MKEKASRFFTRPIIYLTVFGVLLILAQWLMRRLELKSVIPYANGIWLILLCLSGVAWIVSFAKCFIAHTVLRRVVIAVPIILSIVLTYFTFIFSLISGTKESFIFTSPDGSNAVVVLEGGYIDAEYTAYPVKYRFFYREQDNGYVSIHDFWGGAGIDVEWISNEEAHVKIDTFGFRIPNRGTNENNLIIVSFDE